MNAALLLPVDPDTLVALSSHLRDTGSEHSLLGAASLAIRAWIVADSAPTDAKGSRPGPAAAAAPATTHCAARGYQWKELFLPDGTDMRMQFEGETYHARVIGDAIVYEGRRVSPRQLTMAIAGDGRNAWRDLSIRLPGEQHFRPACLLRRNQQARIKVEFEAGGAAPAPESPAAAIAAAAASMSEALRTALILVEHSNAQSLPQYERRVDNKRRANDVLADHVMFD
jgi:hypothetical protein